MIEKCNFRTNELYCKLCRVTTFIGMEGDVAMPLKTIPINPLCDGEENCIHYQTYKKLAEPKHKCMWNTIGCQLYDRPHTPEDCVA